MAGLAACLLNPHGHHAFTLPLELAYLVSSLGDWVPEWLVPGGVTLRALEHYDPQFLSGLTLWLSPLSEEYWSNPGRGRNVAGLAYFPLLLIGIVSFVLATPAGDGRRAAPLAAAARLAGLRRTQRRTCPAYPFLRRGCRPLDGVNLQQFARGQFTLHSRAVRLWAVGGRAATALALLRCWSWPGRAGSPPPGRRPRSHHVSL